MSTHTSTPSPAFKELTHQVMPHTFSFTLTLQQLSALTLELTSVVLTNVSNSPEPDLLRVFQAPFKPLCVLKFQLSLTLELLS